MVRQPALSSPAPPQEPPPRQLSKSAKGEEATSGDSQISTGASAADEKTAQSSIISFPRSTSASETNQGKEDKTGGGATSSSSMVPPLSSTSSAALEEIPSWTPPVWLGNLMLDGAAGGAGGTGATPASSNAAALGALATGATASASANQLPNSTSSKSANSLSKTWAAPHPHYHRLPHVFSVPVPAVPAAVYAALRERLHAPELRQLHQLQHRLLEHRNRAASVRAKIAQLEGLQERALRHANEAAERELERSWGEIEEQHRTAYEAAKEGRRAAWRQALEDECRREQEAADAATATEVADANGRHRKRPRNEAENREGLSMSTPLHQGESKPTDPGGEGADSDEADFPPSAALREAQEKEREASSLVAEKQQELEKAQENLDQLQEKRSEIVWLLKQVIKAEEKLKAKSNRKPEANQLTSKGA